MSTGDVTNLEWLVALARLGPDDLVACRAWSML